MFKILLRSQLRDEIEEEHSESEWSEAVEEKERSDDIDKGDVTDGESIIMLELGIMPSEQESKSDVGGGIIGAGGVGQSLNSLSPTTSTSTSTSSSKEQS